MLSVRCLRPCGSYQKNQHSLEKKTTQSRKRQGHQGCCDTGSSCQLAAVERAVRSRWALKPGALLGRPVSFPSPKPGFSAAGALMATPRLRKRQQVKDRIDQNPAGKIVHDDAPSARKTGQLVHTYQFEGIDNPKQHERGNQIRRCLRQKCDAREIPYPFINDNSLIIFDAEQFFGFIRHRNAHKQGSEES